MENGLVVLEATPAVEQLVTLATEFAAGVDASLTLLFVEDEYTDDEDRQKMTALTGADQVYEVGLDGADRFVADVGEKFVGDAVPYEGASAVGDTVGRVRAALDQHGCDHIFMLGRTRSPKGKAVFGDVTQSIMLDTELPVTVAMG